MIHRFKKILSRKLTSVEIDKIFLENDKVNILRTNNINYIPNLKYRRGGKISYAEWAHVIGLFQSMFYFHLEKKSANKILDIGCGTGLLAMASMPYITNGGEYMGLDVVKKNIDFCKQHYNNQNLKFEHFNVNNQNYANNQSEELIPWPIESESYDLITALSVWTHLNEKHSIYYFSEVNRVLKKGGKAIITFFYLDDIYTRSIDIRNNAKGRFHGTNQQNWIFSKKIYDSENWYCPQWVKVPEEAVGIDVKALEIILRGTNLELTNYYLGNWKEQAGYYFQDVLVFQKK